MAKKQRDDAQVSNSGVNAAASSSSSSAAAAAAIASATEAVQPSSSPAAVAPILPHPADDDDEENEQHDAETPVISKGDGKDLYVQHNIDTPGVVDGFGHLCLHAVAHETAPGPMPVAAQCALEDPPQIAFSGYMRLFLDGVAPRVITESLQQDALVVMSFLGEHTTAVVEREHNVLGLGEARANRSKCLQAMYDELERWRSLGTFRRIPLSQAKNVCDSRWVLKWKKISDTVKEIRCRLTVRGFRDLQGPSLETFSATASRGSQRLVVSIGVQRQWALFGLDVAQAFLKGLTFDQLADQSGSERRSVQFRVPPGSVAILQRLEGYGNFNPATEVLDLVRPGFGLKDAPRLWSLALQQALREEGWHPTQSDPQLYLKHQQGKLIGICSAHVDDLKGAAEEWVREALMKHLTAKFGKLKEMAGSFEHCGVQHVQLKGGGYRLHQAHYVRQLHPLADDEVRGWPADKPLPQHLASAYVSLVCAMAWTLLTAPAIAVYISYLQRHLKQPCAEHTRAANRVLRFLKCREHGVNYLRMKGPFRLLAVSDSAFCASETDGLATRGAFIMLASGDGQHTPGGQVHLLDWVSKKQTHVCRATFSAELFALLDAANVALKVSSVLAELLWGPTSAASLAAAQEEGRLPVPLHIACDAKSVATAAQGTGPVKTSEAHLSIHILKVREWLRRKVLAALWWIDTRDMVSDGLTKGSLSREAIVFLCEQGTWLLKHAVLRVPAAAQAAGEKK